MKKKYEITEAKYEESNQVNKTNNIYDKLFIGILIFVIIVLLILLLVSFIGDKELFKGKINTFRRELQEQREPEARAYLQQVLLS